MTTFLIIISQFILIWQTEWTEEGSLQLDDFQNVYIYDSNSLTKFDKTGTSHFTYSNLRKGEISSVDVTNPLRILVYFQENNEVVFLDNTLSLQNSSLLLNELDLFDVTLVSSSYQNHIWTYRQANQILTRISNKGVVTNESGNISSWNQFPDVRFDRLIESGNFLYLASDNGQIMIFDQYGTFVRNVDLGNIDNLNFKGDLILFSDHEGFKAYSHILKSEETILLYSDLDQIKNQELAFNLHYMVRLDEKSITLNSLSKATK